MKSRLALIKVGGSFITDKSKPFTARPQHITRFAKEFAAVWEKYHETTDFILGNGAGSFGHVPAHEYGLQNGATTPRQRYGMAITHNSVVRLNNLVTNALTAEQVPAFSASPGTLMTYRNGKRDTLYLDSVTQLLQTGCVPVMHGDGAPDKSRGVTIISTEQALQACLNHLHAVYQHTVVIYVMDTPGLLDAAGQLVPELLPNQAISPLGKTGHDVTGSIMSKVANAREAAAQADAVYLIGGHEEEALLKAVKHETVGTRVYA